MLTRNFRENRNNSARRGPPLVAKTINIPFEALRTTNRVGWRRDTSILICHGCYEWHHVLSQCTVNITDLYRMVSNLDSLTANGKVRVPDKYYLMARAATTGTQENELQNEVKTAEKNPKKE